MTELEKKKRLRTCHKNLKGRCNNPNHPLYKDYGGRGIRVCKEWNVFANFWADMGWQYKEGLTLDRIDNNGNYCYENCRWTTYKVQANNRRKRKAYADEPFTMNGETKTVREWLRNIGLSINAYNGRLSCGWSKTDAISKPRRVYPHHLK